MIPRITMKAGVRKADGVGVRLVPGLTVRAGQLVAGKYRVEELLGSDASGVTLSARNVHAREPVLLKILASYTDGQAEQLERRMAKARIAVRLKSPHAARVLDIGTSEDGMPYIAYEALIGKTLEEELAERGPLPVADATRWVLEACEAVAEAHTLGLVHGDLKPKNILLAEPKVPARNGGPPASTRAPEADPRVLKILDFAATSPLEAISDQTNAAFCSSPAYLAPEQIQDPSSADARADVWAMGILLYELLSGSLPFTADTVSGVIVAVVYDTPTLLTDAPYPLAKIVARCLEKDPAKRPQDLYELSALLAAFAGANGVRLSERVAVALETPPPPSLRTDDLAKPASVAPLSVALRASGIPPKKPAAQRRKTWQRVARLLAAAAALGGVGFGIGRIAMAMQAAQAAEEPAVAAAISTTTVTSESLALPAQVAPAGEPAEPEGFDGKPDAALAAEPVISFAPSAGQPVIPTPLATADEPATATPAPPPPVAAPLAAAAPLATPPRAAAPLPPPPAHAAPRSRLPAGLPTTREQAALPPSAARPSDSTYLRGFLSDRK